MHLRRILIIENFSNCSSMEGTDENSFSFNSLNLAVYISTWVLGVLGILLNLVFVYLMWKVKELRSTTNYYLLNMAIADITYLILTIVKQVLDFSNCYIWVLLNIALSMSLFSITILGIERYMAICRPFKFSQFRKRFVTPTLIAAIWILSILLSIAQYFLCSPSRTALIEKILLIIYSLPFFLAIPVTAIMYTLCVIELSKPNLIDKINARANREKRQIIRMLILTAASFFICTLPYLIFTIYTSFYKTPSITPAIIIAYNLVSLLLMVNSTFNPVIYQSSKRHRQALYCVLPKCCQTGGTLDIQIKGSEQKKDGSVAV